MAKLTKKQINDKVQAVRDEIQATMTPDNAPDWALACMSGLDAACLASSDDGQGGDPDQATARG